MAPNQFSPATASLKLPTFSSIPSGSALVINTSSVWGQISSSTKQTFAPAFSCALERRLYIMCIASAAAVPSSSNEELANGIAVISQTIVWKFNRASNLPAKSPPGMEYKKYTKQGSQVCCEELPMG